MRLQPKKHVPNLRVYEPGRPLEEVARELGLPMDDMVKLASNENPLGPSPRAVAAIRSAADRMHLYPDGGCHYLREAMASKFGVAADTLIFGCGSNEIIELLGHVFMAPGTNIVMSEQAFIIYHLIAAGWQAETRFVPSTRPDYGHNLAAMAEAIDANTRIVFVANPNNPTGSRLDPEEIHAFAEKIPEDVLLVLDEAYIELLDPDQRPELQLSRDNVLVLRTFSKAYGLAGLRVGYGIGHPELIACLERFRQPFNVTAMGQTAALAALDDDAHVVELCRLTRSGLRQLAEGAAALGVPVVNSCVNFILLETGRGRERFEALKRHGVIVRPMDGYGLPEHIRVSVGTTTENQRFLDALGKVLSA